MADILRVQVSDKVENRGLFSSHTGTVYIEQLTAPDGKELPWRIYVDTPTTSHFDAAPVGSLLFNIASGGLAYIHQTATTWVELGDLT